MSEKFEPVIGLEVHAQLLTDTKIFCSCKNAYGAPPNSLTCPVCLGMPGTLPVLNRKAVEYAIKMGLATDCSITAFSRFARKNYFYPDLPKGYQISQYDEPLCQNGKIKIQVNGIEKNIGITRIHLEEDAGKSIHGFDNTLVDFNRCGVALIEIVSEPDLRSPEEAYAYLIKLKQILEYLEICDCNMEEGSLRCDANISLRPIGEEKFGTKTEMKNMNSFRGVERALRFEIERQKAILEKGKNIIQQTMLWDEAKGEARPMRSKEESHDYRYFPEPDLVPIEVEENWKTKILNDLPELPDQKYFRFLNKYNLRHYDAAILTSDKYLAEYFERVNDLINDPQLVSKWIQGEVLRTLSQKNLTSKQIPLAAENLGELLNLIKAGTISANIAKEVFDKMVENNESAKIIVEREKLVQVSDDSELEQIIQTVISENPNEVERYRRGAKNLFAFFMGQVMKKTKGKANPGVANNLLRKALDN
ncbi:MAG TPA: Asp-tRNA(Asn)/Glu-tRNA(Gln) amidotransferase subunit GatB [Candidatus Marinimicrobia bacterium]|nr:Asp-tRNA(Asn)/Glu-tRNA(Gln) amidotransferase subunit GatB [Candidatus Neomarinimicrobiota bacterium]HQE94780.1 Asp-tRNA(Asn)/Glu-tRNA(Gln) amidotransferase subunit GatB [Candidatus Neomarinimicrobiota bacterium]HQK11153.1 Asp-tRNA(Asn)/Glu-tRNA(Gln) amidotransferase subunit GatB [Candidatus Neomarinimicrobiota bacterium]